MYVWVTVQHKILSFFFVRLEISKWNEVLLGWLNLWGCCLKINVCSWTGEAMTTNGWAAGCWVGFLIPICMYVYVMYVWNEWIGLFERVILENLFCHHIKNGWKEISLHKFCDCAKMFSLSIFSQIYKHTDVFYSVLQNYRHTFVIVGNLKF